MTLCWVTARLSALTFRLRHRPAAKYRRKEPPAISWQCAEDKTLQGHRGARRESRETHGCLPPHSLSQGDSSDPAWHFGCCTGGSALPRWSPAPGTGRISARHRPCPAGLWAPSCWDFRLGKAHLEKAAGVAPAPCVTLAAAQPQATGVGKWQRAGKTTESPV